MISRGRLLFTLLNSPAEMPVENGGNGGNGETREDFRTYEELDDNERIAVTQFKLDIDGLTKNEDAYVYYDKGVDHFGATFEHDFKLTIQDGDLACVAVGWAVSNVVEEAGYWQTNNSQAIGCRPNLGGREPDVFIDLYNFESGLFEQFVASVLTTPYYMTAERTSETSLELRIYNDEDRTDLADTLTVAVTDGRRYQHVFGCSSFNNTTAPAISFDVEDLELNE